MLSKNLQTEFIKRLEAIKVTGNGAGHARLKNLVAIYEMKYGLERALLGIDQLQHMKLDEILSAVAEVNECSRDFMEVTGDGWYIDPEATLNGYIQAARKILDVCGNRGNVLLATGHSGAMLGFYLELAKIIRILGGMSWYVLPGRY